MNRRLFSSLPSIRQWAAVCALVWAASSTANAGPAHFWISTSSQNAGGPAALSSNLAVGTNKTFYIWAQPATDAMGNFKSMQSFSLNLLSSEPLFDILDSFQVHNPVEDAPKKRFQAEFIRDSDDFVNLSPQADYRISSSLTLSKVQQASSEPGDGIFGLGAGIAIISGSTGIGGEQPGDQPSVNPADRAWLVASFELNGVKESGSSSLYLQVGALGINNIGELSQQTDVIFGAPTDPSYNAKLDREPAMPKELDTPDLVIHAVTGAAAGDFDGDGDVDGADFIAWQTNFPVFGSASRSQGDNDADGDVDGADFDAWQSNFPLSPGSWPSQIPEPAGILLFAIGAGIALSRRRGNRFWASTFGFEAE